MKRHKRHSARPGWTVFAFLLAAVLIGARLAGRTALHSDRFGNLSDRLDFLPDSLRRHLPGYEETDWSRTVAYVPLDDRTDNLEDVELLAEASGWTILLPDRDLFRTALDGQPRNADGTGHGNREALLEWVREMDAAGCDRFVLSLDQLLSGGLVHSRTVSEPWPLCFDDSGLNNQSKGGLSNQSKGGLSNQSDSGLGRQSDSGFFGGLFNLFGGKDRETGYPLTMDEAEAFRRYILPLAEDGQNRVYLFDSVVRLSPTVAYRGLKSEEYYALREYGMTERPALSDSVLTLDNVFARYPFGPDGMTLAEDALGSDRFREYLTEDLLEDYLRVRRRKLTLTDSILSALAEVPAENVHLLIGIDDSSNRPNIQYNELRYLERRAAETGLGSRVRIMPGLDSLARLLLGQLAREEYGNYTVKASVRYIGGTEGRHSSEFDLYTLEEVADLHLDLFGAERVSESAAELQFVVMTAPDDPARGEEYREELVSLLEANIARHIPTVLDEASGNAYGDALEQELLKRVSFAGLVAFAGKYDQANVTGAAFAMGFSRYLYLKCGRAEGGAEPESRSDAEQPRNSRAQQEEDERNSRTKGNSRVEEKEAEKQAERNLRADLAQVRQMANSMALTEYILHVRAPLNAYVERVGLNWNNMLFPAALRGDSAASGGTTGTASGKTAGTASGKTTGTASGGTTGTASGKTAGTASGGRPSKEQQVLRKLETLFRPDLLRVCENLRGTRLLTGVDPWEEQEVGNVRITDLYFPWNRTFETAFTVEAELSDMPDMPDMPDMSDMSAAS